MAANKKTLFGQKQKDKSKKNMAAKNHHIPCARYTSGKNEAAAMPKIKTKQAIKKIFDFEKFKPP
jgi:hypothetical protein